ncbi:hypothetical protein RFI_23057, partial [Reticulomyxa filosa]
MSNDETKEPKEQNNPTDTHATVSQKSIVVARAKRTTHNHSDHNAPTILISGSMPSPTSLDLSDASLDEKVIEEMKLGHSEEDSNIQGSDSMAPISLSIAKMKQLAEDAFAKGDLKTSLHMWQMLLPYAEGMPHLYVAYAVLLCFEFKRYEEAETYLLKALQSNPQNIAMRRHLANVYMEWHKYDQAVQQFDQIISIYNDHTISHYNGK